MGVEDTPIIDVALESPTGIYLQDLARRMGRAGPVSSNFAAVLCAIGGYLENKVPLDQVAIVLQRAGINVRRFHEELKPGI